MVGTSLKYNQVEILQPACLAFNIDYHKAKLIRYFSNLVYDCGDSILRLTHFNDNSEVELVFFVTNKSYAHTGIRLNWVFSFL